MESLAILTYSIVRVSPRCGIISLNHTS